MVGRTVLLLLIFMVSLPVYSQLRGGFLGSINSSTLTGTMNDVDEIERVRRNTLGLGLIGILDVHRNVGLELSASVVERGGENGEPGSDFREVRLVYAEFPFLLKVSAKHPYLLAGGYVSSLMNAEIIEGDDDNATPSKDLFELSDVGWMVGAGANVFASESTHFHMEILYSHGVKELVFMPEGDDSLKNRAIQFRFGFTFNLLNWGNGE